MGFLRRTEKKNIRGGDNTENCRRKKKKKRTSRGGERQGRGKDKAEEEITRSSIAKLMSLPLAARLQSIFVKARRQTGRRRRRRRRRKQRRRIARGPSEICDFL